MQKRSKDIIFYVETEVQFDSLKPLLMHLRDKTKITFDIVVPRAVSAATIVNKDVYEGGAKAVTENGFSIVRSVDDFVLPDKIVNTKYKVLISAYIYRWHYQNLNVKYRIMFPYASYYFNKPNWTIGQFIHQDYMADALLSHAVGTSDVTDIFTKTYVVPSLKLMDFHKKSKRVTKPVVFFAPTYNDIEFAANFLKDIDAIKEKYTVIMRSHHRASRVDSNKGMSKKILEKADRVYDVEDFSIITPLEEADVVVSDNSAAIFDAIYCGVPVALFCQNPNSFHYKDINTAQSELVNKGDILWTSDSGRMLDVIDKTLSAKMLKKQNEMRRKLFPKNNINPVGAWMKVISIYLEDDLPYEYSLAKQYWVDNINFQVANCQTMSATIEDLHLQIKDRDNRIYHERNPGIMTATRRLAKACLYKLHFLKRSA